MKDWVRELWYVHRITSYRALAENDPADMHDHRDGPLSSCSVFLQHLKLIAHLFIRHSLLLTSEGHTPGFPPVP